MWRQMASFKHSKRVTCRAPPAPRPVAEVHSANKRNNHPITLGSSIKHFRIKTCMIKLHELITINCCWNYKHDTLQCWDLGCDVHGATNVYSEYHQMVSPSSISFRYCLLCTTCLVVWFVFFLLLFHFRWRLKFVFCSISSGSITW